MRNFENGSFLLHTAQQPKLQGFLWPRQRSPLTGGSKYSNVINELPCGFNQRLSRKSTSEITAGSSVCGRIGQTRGCAGMKIWKPSRSLMARPRTMRTGRKIMPVDKEMTILIVDDFKTMRTIIQRILKQLGFTNTLAAEDGHKAVELLTSHTVDLIISDWKMPNMDGLALLQWVRTSEAHHHIPFVMATAQSDKMQTDIILGAGGNKHVVKPFNAEELAESINEVFGMAAAPPSAEEPKPSAGDRIRLKIAHIQITDHLALGVLKHRIERGDVTPRHFDLETVRMTSWNNVQLSLEKGEVDAAFVLAPIAMDLFAYQVPIRMVLLAHKNGSIFVRNKNFSALGYDSLAKFFKFKTITIPHKMSVHNMLAHRYLKGLGLSPGFIGDQHINVRFEVVPPVDMPEFMRDNDDVAGFIVAEPLGSSAITKGIAEIQFPSAAVWEDHPCCVIAARDEFIGKYPDAMYEFTAMIAEAGRYAEANRTDAAEIAVHFLDPDGRIGLTPEMLEQIFSQPQSIKLDNLYPVMEEFDEIQRYMFKEMGVGQIIDIEKFMDLRFADAARKV